MIEFCISSICFVYHSLLSLSLSDRFLELLSPEWITLETSSPSSRVCLVRLCKEPRGKIEITSERRATIYRLVESAAHGRFIFWFPARNRPKDWDMISDGMNEEECGLNFLVWMLGCCSFSLPLNASLPSTYRSTARLAVELLTSRIGVNQSELSDKFIKLLWRFKCQFRNDEINRQILSIAKQQKKLRY